ncbi:MAG: hypothetical protein IKQ00_05580 [Butyrivibrio sp.]|nr:hypothetical protein [Butyrivibrio sp.]
MNLQIILCIEANKQSDTDKIYIKETINRFFTYGNNIKLSFVNMGGKTNYNSKGVERNVMSLTKDYKIGNTVVIYCIDLDGYESNPDQVMVNQKIYEYIVKKGFELVWFCHDIEEVYYGNSVNKDDKTKMAIEFKKKVLISNVNEKKLRAKKEAKGMSNILDVLGKYL